MKAKLLHHEKRRYDDEAILEMRLWQVEQPVPGCDHRLKYSLFYGRPGSRQVGYDNERGKGGAVLKAQATPQAVLEGDGRSPHHRHFGDEQELYAFVSVRRLMADFLADVDKVRQDA